MLSEDLKRLDILLFCRGLAASRTEAQRLIAAHDVFVDGVPIDKANRRFPDSCEVVVLQTRQTYVSRGGNKLAAALDAFQITPTGFNCLDVGISTGGFTDCLLKRGANRVIGIDVGHGQLHPRIASDSRVEQREGVNARILSPADFSFLFDLICVDVSFISLTLVLPRLPQLMKPEGVLVCLIKPQFEVGAGNVGKNGIVTNSKHRANAREFVHAAALTASLELIGSITSPITGGDGNSEYLSCFRPTRPSTGV
jgi:23S rRNA (cytidine1920-2'-O)/16S rRNA (cytidine1409-2'-O)-methyltransferase